MTQASTPEQHRGTQAIVKTGPGARLRELRVSCKLELARVAAELHLPVATIEALEQDHYKALPDPVFVRGYLRAYARLLETEAEPLIAAYDSLGYREPAEADVGASPTPADRDRILRISAYGMIGLLALGGVAGWWFSRSSPLPVETAKETEGQPAEPMAAAPTVAQDSDAVPESAPAEPKIPLADSVPEPDGPPGRQESQTEVIPGVQVAAVPTPEGSGDAADDGGIEAIPGGVDREPQSSVFGTLDEATPNFALNLPVAEPALETGTEPEDPPALVLEFTLDSWVEVRDADRVRKLVGIMNANTRRVITGKTPFSVILGNSEGVRVTFHGEPFDHTPFVRKNIARFDIGEPPSQETEP